MTSTSTSPLRARLAGAAALSVLALGGAVVAAPHASALVTCTTKKTWVLGTGAHVTVPVSGSGGAREGVCQLAKGNVNRGVEAIQAAMNRCYAENLRVDGNFGALTKAALIRVQNRVHTDPDGIYGPATGNAMNWAKYDERGRFLGCGHVSVDPG